ncbi:MAG TPA: YCF48-related protein [Bacteroidia bacterium]|nr:YCF48-related protein [Bacteroidia bacterium]HNU33832.1 YCF48-related protein [Bacteroidia bacterium]
MRGFVFFLLPFFFLIGCKKEKLNIPFNEIDTRTSLDLNQLQALSSDTLFLCGGRNEKGIILKSVNAGKSWNTLAEFERNVYSVFFINEKKGFVGCDSSVILKTIDGGITWQQFIDYDGVPQLHKVPLRKFSFLNETTGFVCGGKGFGKGIIYQTNDGGNSWTKILTDHEMRSLEFNQNGNGVCAGYGAIYNYANEWNLLNVVSGEFYTGVIYNSSFFSCGFNGGIYKSDNGVNWSCINKANKSYSARQHYNCIAAMDNIVFCAGISGMCAYSTNGGNSFEKGETFGGTNINSVALLSNKKGLAIGESGKLFEFSLPEY